MHANRRNIQMSIVYSPLPQQYMDYNRRTILGIHRAQTTHTHEHVCVCIPLQNLKLVDFFEIAKELHQLHLHSKTTVDEGFCFLISSST